MALFRFYLLLFFSGVKAVYFHFSFQFLCKEMVLVRKSCPDQKLVYTFSDPKFPVKPQLSKGPTTFNSKDSSVISEKLHNLQAHLQASLYNLLFIHHS